MIKMIMKKIKVMIKGDEEDKGNDKEDNDKRW